MHYDTRLADGTASADAAYEFQVDSAFGLAPIDAKPAPVAARRPRDIVVEIASGERLTNIRPCWVDLVTRVEEPNAFMDPVLVRIAGDVYPRARPTALLAWKQSAGQPQLVGVWAFSVGLAPRSVLPVRVLVAPPFVHGYAAAPVIDPDCLDETLDAMLEAIAADTQLPKTVVLDAMATDGQTMTALTRVLARRGSPARLLEQARRPKLKSDLDGKRYLEQAISASSRKKLRQHRRRLADKGELSSLVARDPTDVCSALEQFLTMEVSGWKGRQATALLCDEADAAFTRAAIMTLAAHGCVSIHALYLGERPVSMQIVLHAGSAAFTWKIAYDEELRDVSPGMLLLEDYTATFLADTRVASVNSCTYDENTFMSVWTEREAIANVWIDARRGGSWMFEILWRLQKGYGRLRSLAKTAYLARTRK